MDEICSKISLKLQKTAFVNGVKLFVLIFFALNACCAEPNFAYSHKFELKKDEMAKILFKDMIDEENSQDEYYSFRWTLYDATNLIANSWWRKYPRHMTMSLRHGARAYSELIFVPLTKLYKDEVRLYLVFTRFEKGMATIMAYVKDETARSYVEFIDPKR